MKKAKYLLENRDRVPILRCKDEKWTRLFSRSEISMLLGSAYFDYNDIIFRNDRRILWQKELQDIRN